MADGARTHVYFDATVTPNRSLGRFGLRILLAAVLAYNLVLMGFFLAIGAFPVPVFLGLDFVGLWIAFRVSRRRAETVERVRVTREEVRVARGRPGQEAEVWRSPSAFTVVEVCRGGRAERLRLRAGGRMLEVGGGLGEDEREGFRAALARALDRARADRYRG